MPPALRTWLQLVRAPNLFTVPGDPFAGYLLAAYGAFGTEVFCALGASVCFYAAGLLDNDLADLAEDRRERPQRPLPSGAASPRAVAMVAGALVAVGLLLAARLGAVALTVALAIVVAVGLYNHVTKHLPVVGALNMGVCRGLSMLLGATAAPHPELLWRLLATGRLDPLLIACGFVALYIAAITHLARFETKTQSPLLAKWLPALVMLGGSVFFVSQIHMPSLLPLGGGPTFFERLHSNTFWNTAAILGVAVFNAGGAALRLASDAAAPVPPVIGQLIRLWLLAQTAFCAAVGTGPGSLAAALLIMAWPISRSVSRRFYAS